MYLQIIFALALTTQSFAFYVSSAVTELDSDNFDRVVLQSGDVWIVQLYAKWSEDSRKAVEEFIKLANCLKYESFAFMCSHSHTERNSSIYAGAINVNDSEEKFIESFNFTGVPVFKIYGQNKSAPIVYGGAHSADEILAFVRDMVIINADETISDYGVEPEQQKYTATEVTVETMNDENEYDYDDDYEVMTEFIPTSAAAATEMVDDVTEDVWKLEAWFPTNIEVEITDKETEDVDRMEATTEWTPTSAEAETEETEDVYESDNSTQSSEKTADETIDNESKNEYDDDYGIVTEWIPTSAAAATEIVYDENEKVYLNDPLMEWTPTSAEAETLDEETEDVYRSDTSTQSSKKIADEAMDDESKYEYDDDYEVVTEWTLTSAEAATEMFDEETEDVYGNDFVTEWTPTSAEFETLDEEAEDVYENDFVTEWTPTNTETETLDEETEDVHRNETVTQSSKKTANETMLNAGGVQNKMFCSAIVSVIVAYFLTLRQ